MAGRPISAAQNRMTSRENPTINEKELTKGQIRKLNALRKSIGEEIAHKAFAEWLKSSPVMVEEIDKNAETIAELLLEQIEKSNLRIPRGGYLVRRGRGRVIVEHAAE